MHQKILILDFGSQFTQLIARRVRELNVYCEIHPYNHFPEPDKSVKGIILSGSPHSVREKDSPRVPLESFYTHAPVLGVCYGAQLIAQEHGGKVEKSKVREYGRANLVKVEGKSNLLKGVKKGSQVWMSHADTIMELPEDFRIIAGTADVPVAAYKVKQQEIYGLQFHPEVYHSTDGLKILGNFVYDICGCKGDWTPGSFVDETVEGLKKQLGKDKVIMALSGGVDSTVAARLIHNAIGKNLYCIFVDNGLLRKNEYENVLHSYKDFGLNVIGVDARERFYSKLKGVNDPEKKRKIIGGLFIDIFQEEAKKIKGAKWLGQGTIYPDVIESVSVKGPSATIKSHHNVGGLPEKMDLKIVEPLRTLFKDEVRRVGRALKISSEFIDRHPFPGPGLAIRILGDITADKVRIVQEADDIFISRLKKDKLYKKVWQAGAIFLPVQSVGVMGDERTYENVICLRAVTSTDGMTADWSHLPYEFLAAVSNEIINKVKGVNRVVFDISSKPPATIEWE
ncbi:MAG: glutamine-hydrolyzing GMP synthase [Flavobacteriales bacterium]